MKALILILILTSAHANELAGEYSDGALNSYDDEFTSKKATKSELISAFKQTYLNASINVEIPRKTKSWVEFSGDDWDNEELLQWYKETMCKDPSEQRGMNGEYWIWEYPDYSRDYMVVADVARGDGGDFSAFHIIDVEKVTQVAEFKGQPSTKEFGFIHFTRSTSCPESRMTTLSTT